MTESIEAVECRTMGYVDEFIDISRALGKVLLIVPPHY